MRALDPPETYCRSVVRIGARISQPSLFHPQKLRSENQRISTLSSVKLLRFEAIAYGAVAIIRWNSEMVCGRFMFLYLFSFIRAE